MAEDYTCRKFGSKAMSRGWGWGMRWVIFCMMVVAWHGWWQEPQKAAEEKPATEAKAVADGKKLVNPVKATASSIALGKKAYGLDCAMCHGKTGAGDGDLAGDMKLKLLDYRDPESLKSMSDGEIYTIIAKGKGQMSGEEGRMKPTQIWNVVNYVRSLAKK
jgi:mono/diheme cytochrome c family protein